MIAPVPSFIAPSCANAKLASAPGLRWGVVIGERCPPIALNRARPKCDELAGDIAGGSPGSRLGLRRPSDVIEFECASCEAEEPEVPLPLPLPPCPNGDGPRENWDELEPREELFSLEGARELEPEPMGESGLSRSGIECSDAAALCTSSCGSSNSASMSALRGLLDSDVPVTVTARSCVQLCVGMGGASSRTSPPLPITSTLTSRSLCVPNVADEGMSELESRHERIFAMCSKPGGTAGPPRDDVVENGETAARAGTGVSRTSTGSARVSAFWG